MVCQLGRSAVGYYIQRLTTNSFKEMSGFQMSPATPQWHITIRIGVVELL